MPNQSPVFDALAKVIDPELRLPITELGMVDSASVDGSVATATIKLTVVGCPAAARIEQDVIDAQPRQRHDPFHPGAVQLLRPRFGADDTPAQVGQRGRGRDLAGRARRQPPALSRAARRDVPECALCGRDC
mgnify:CR=1 FL=1